MGSVLTIKKLSRILLFILLAVVSCYKENRETAGQGETWSFVVFSDVQQGYGIYSQLAGIIGRIRPEPLLAVCCGDLMLRSANEAEWLYFIRYSKPVTDHMPIYIARGNHEGNDPASEWVLREMWYFPGNTFFYSVRKMDCLFIILDTQEKGKENGILDGQFEWLKAQLDTAVMQPGLKHIFIFMHHPLYPQGLHQGQNLVNAGQLHALFLGYPRIRAVFAGHDHLFNKYVRDGIPYITTGGGGGSLFHGYGGDYHHFVKVSFFKDEGRVNLKTIGVFNEIIDNFDL